MNYLPKNLTFEEGVAFINGFSLIDISSEHGTPLFMYMIGIISKTIYLNSQMLLEIMRYTDMRQKLLYVENLLSY